MTPDHVLDLLRDRLDPLDAEDCTPVRGDGDLNGLPSPTGRILKPAAVLAPLILHDGPPRFVLTLRADHLPTHAGQISFPGGRVEAGESLAEAALRETEEEIGVARDHVDLIGRFDAYETVTGYAINPFVGILKPGFTLTPEPGEVADVFETPFEFLMDAANHQRHSREFQGRMRHFYAMPWQDRYIWGATAGMLKSLHGRLYG
ncbi:NUDIX hydrolase [Hyphobacterium marinum]|uniref:CoA pyrophosphatase n=1 Tax=Hyphobacterium marinum TaxID=3116574 RepID=A0ABU7LX77_9PROT|nr:CoA pyrophosphatase [Hyphobacterium sp. Y6023]MEE2566158.1 CoA pyrophosphatase [Hyphobacterium sp. Y6023]